jgi:hypothetical protein
MKLRQAQRPSTGSRPGLLEFRPWMLAVAVILGCLLGIAVMERLRAPREMWAQVMPTEARR